MSFSKEIKEELCKAVLQNDEQRLAMEYGMLLFSKSFSSASVSLTTESRPAALTFSEMLASLSGVIVEMSVKLTRRRGESSIFHLSVPDKNECVRIFESFGHRSDQPHLRINRANIDGEGCAACFLRGVFLVCGSVTDPQKDYHLEFAVPHKNLASDLERLLSEIEEIRPEPHTIRRQGSYVVYLKGSATIEDMLTYLGAPMASLGVMQSSMVKSVRNRVNRQINSETANLKKTAAASALQLQAIDLINKKQGLESLSDELKEVAYIRREHPEYNLRELGQALKVPISRSGVNHRLQRLMMIAEELQSQ